jgi:hypothetical protein
MPNEPNLKKFIDEFVKINPKVFDVLCHFKLKAFELQFTNKKGKMVDDENIDYEEFYENCFVVILNQTDIDEVKGEYGSIEVNLRTKRVKIDVYPPTDDYYNEREGILTCYIIGEDGKIVEDADFVW